MNSADFVTAIDDARIVGAIAAAEKLTSGEIRVFVSQHDADDPVATAQRHFHRLAMHKTVERNAVLIFVAPLSQKFAVIGDEAIHQRCGQSFWDAVASAMSSHFRAGEFTSGIEHAITTAAEQLALYFPADASRGNELPDRVERD